MADIERWRVQAALVLLGVDDPDSLVRAVTVGHNELAVSFRGISRTDHITIVNKASDTRLHVLGIDPENGNAELNPVADGDVAFFTGAGMYLDGLTKHANGTLMPVFKKAAPE